MRPEVGGVMRDRIFSRVDLPAPLRPMMPTTSPGSMEKETSRNAQNSSRAKPVPQRKRRHSFRAA